MPKIQRRQKLTAREWAAITSRRPVVRKIPPTQVGKQLHGPAPFSPEKPTREEEDR